MNFGWPICVYFGRLGDSGIIIFPLRTRYSISSLTRHFQRFTACSMHIAPLYYPEHILSNDSRELKLSRIGRRGNNLSKRDNYVLKNSVEFILKLK